MKILGVQQEYQIDEIGKMLKTQYSGLDDNDRLNVKYIHKNALKKDHRICIETSSSLFNKLTFNEKVYIGWERCKVIDVTYVTSAMATIISKVSATIP